MKQYPRLHPRSKIAFKATSDMSSVLHSIRDKYGLTITEYLQFLTSEMQFTLGRLLREERHGDLETPAGIEKSQKEEGKDEQKGTQTEEAKVPQM